MRKVEASEAEVDRRQEEIYQAIEDIRDLRQRSGRITVQELPSARDEGREG
jgi:hypothetical protein